MAKLESSTFGVQYCSRVFQFSAEVWVYDGGSPWHFVTLPVGLAAEIEAGSAAEERPFGSVPVEVTIGSSAWDTSIFKDLRRNSYVLPIKRGIRTAERIVRGDVVEVGLRVREG
jgi:hypothetical protein